MICSLNESWVSIQSNRRDPRVSPATMKHAARKIFVAPRLQSLAEQITLAREALSAAEEVVRSRRGTGGHPGAAGFSPRPLGLPEHGHRIQQGAIRVAKKSGRIIGRVRGPRYSELIMRVHEIRIFLGCCSFASQYVFLSLISGSSAAGWMRPSSSVARETRVCSPSAGFFQS